MTETLKLIVVDVVTGLTGLYGGFQLFVGSVAAISGGGGAAIGHAIGGAVVLAIAIKLEKMYGSASKSKAGEV